MVDIDAVKRRFESLLPAVDERMRRLIAAAESLAIDYGGISIVSRAKGESVLPARPKAILAGGQLHAQHRVR